MPNVNIFEWEGSYAISGTISPALPADKPGQVKVRAVGVDDRITFQAAPGDSIDQVDAETTDIVINVPGGADSFLIPLDVENAQESKVILLSTLLLLSLPLVAEQFLLPSTLIHSLRSLSLMTRFRQ